MPRQRMIKAEFFDSGSLALVPVFARYLFIGLWVFADDNGNLKYQTLKLRKQVFPYDDMTEQAFIDALVRLEDIGCIYGYEVDGERYITIPNFLTYQNINRPSSTTIPEPGKVTDKHQIRAWNTSVGQLTEDSVNTHCHAHDSEDSVSTHPERKKEGKKEVTLTNLRVTSSSRLVEAADNGGGDKDHPPLPPEDVFAWVDEHYPDNPQLAETLKRRTENAELEANAVPCPPGLFKTIKGGGTCSTATN